MAYGRVITLNLAAVNGALSFVAGCAAGSRHAVGLCLAVGMQYSNSMWDSCNNSHRVAGIATTLIGQWASRQALQQLYSAADAW